MTKFTMLDMSTGHISKKTNQRLLNREIESVIYYDKPKYGYFIHIPEDLDELEDVPDDLMECLKFAKKHKCDWINLDCDGEIYNELAAYNW